MSSEFSKKSGKRRDIGGHTPTACDQCYRRKTRCNGEKLSCDGCVAIKSPCTYSTGKPLGKPKGSKNKFKRPKPSDEVVQNGKTQEREDNEYRANTGVASTQSNVARSNSDAIDETRAGDAVLPPFPTASDPGMVDQWVPETNAIFLTPSDRTLLDSSTFDDVYMAGQGPVDEAYNAGQIPDIYLGVSGHEQPWPGGSLPFYPTVSGIDHGQWTLFNEFQRSVRAATTQATEAANMGTPNTWQTSSHSDTSSTMHSHARGDETSIPSSCPCNPRALDIISELQALQKQNSALDVALRLAQQGLKVVSSYLACPVCLAPTRSSSPVLLACIVIMQQAFAWYFNTRCTGKESSCLVSIGYLSIGDDDSRTRIIRAVVRQEIERGKSVLNALQASLHGVSSDLDQGAGSLLRNLQQQLGWNMMC